MKRVSLLAALLVLAPVAAMAVPPTQLTDQGGNPLLGLSLPGITAPYTGAPVPCLTTTVGSTPTQILPADPTDTARHGGGMQASSATGVYYSWGNPTLTAAIGGTTFYLAPGNVMLFAGAPNVALYAIAASGSVTVACQAE